jgi:hypothetical protein
VASAQGSDLWSKYAQEVDRDSAAEKLAARMAESSAAEAADDAEAEARRAAPPPQPKRAGRSRGGDDNPVTDFLKSREGRQMANTVVRGVFSLLKKRR